MMNCKYCSRNFKEELAKIDADNSIVCPHCEETITEEDIIDEENSRYFAGPESVIIENE